MAETLPAFGCSCSYKPPFRHEGLKVLDSEGALIADAGSWITAPLIVAGLNAMMPYTCLQHTGLTDKERNILEHAVAWRHPTHPLYRNHYTTGPESDDWHVLRLLCSRGLMRDVGRCDSGDTAMTTFCVTGLGLEAIGAKGKEQ